MKLNIDVLIVGAGYAGLIMQKKLDSLSINSIIFEKGHNHQYSDNDYIIVCKNELPFTGDKVNVITQRNSSGCADFTPEFTQKVYNKRIDIKTFYDEVEVQEAYKIDNEKLLKNARIYGNIDIQKIDIESKTAFGRVLHLNKNVEVKFNKLVSTIPIHEFQKLVNINLLEDFNIFISYFPIGIKRGYSKVKYEDMKIEYYSDPNIPFYRKQYYNNTIYYEYCLNKPYHDNFAKIVVPGKFTKIDDLTMKLFYHYFAELNVFFCGRFATWDPDFLLDQIWEPNSSISNQYMKGLYK